MFPILWVVGSLFAAGVAWCRLTPIIFSKRVLLYGTRAAGKTTFKNYCTKGMLPSIYEPTQVIKIEKIKRESMNKEVQEYLKKLQNWASNNWTVVDTMGESRRILNTEGIIKQIEEADIILYFFRADYTSGMEGEEKKWEELKKIKAHLLSFKNKDTGAYLVDKKVLLIGTHTDKIDKKLFGKKEWENSDPIKQIYKLLNVPSICYVAFTPEKIHNSARTICKYMSEVFANEK